MRASRLFFSEGCMYIATGIGVSVASKESLLHLFVHKARTITIPFDKAFPPQFAAADNPKDEVLRLATLSFSLNEAKELYALEEYEQKDCVCLFIDTFDVSAPFQRGRYLLDSRHEMCLPYDRYPFGDLDAYFGIAVLMPGQSLLVTSTGAVASKVKLSENGTFTREGCSRIDALLLSGSA